MNYTSAVIAVLPTYIALGEGYILISHGIYNPEQLSREVIEFAEYAGFKVAEEVYEDGYEWLDEIESEAIDYLNEHHAPDGAWWGHDGEVGAFGCWPITEDEA